MSIHLTPAARARVSPHGWRRLPSGIWVTQRPLVDTGNAPYFGHLDYEQLLAASARIEGSRLLAPSTVVELTRHGRLLRPVVFPPGPDMSSKARCDAHDRAVLAQIGDDDELPVIGAGKTWVAGALPGKSRIFGWPRSRLSDSLDHDAYHQWLQPLQNAHNRRHVDYSSLCPLEADEDLGVERSPWRGLLASLLRWPARLMDAFEAPAKPRLAHGYRCSVAELYRDAVATGTWHPAGDGYVPQRGDLLVSARAGGDPTKGGNGHVEAVVTPDARRPLTLGGNEANTWVQAPYDLASPDYRGCIERGELGRLAVAVALVEYAAGIKEKPGAAHHERIQLYHAGARRGGSPLAGMPGHESEGASVLGSKAADEVAWCASSQSWAMYEAVRASA